MGHNNALNYKRLNIFFTTLRAIPVVAAALTLVASAPAFACKAESKNLRGSYEVLQAHGGLWTYLEKAGGELRDKSLMGLQLDNKLQLLVVSFETACKENEKNPPSAALAEKISATISKAQAIMNMPPSQNPPAKISEQIHAVIKEVDDLLTGGDGKTASGERMPLHLSVECSGYC